MSRFAMRLAGTLLLLLGILRPAATAQDTHDAVALEMDTPFIRGGMLYRNYCVLCHGERGDGLARAAKLYPGKNLTIYPRPASYYEKIIRKGGESVGASSSMPPWSDELSDQQISDVLAFLAVLGDPVRRGEFVFKTNCVLCHGLRGDGKGRAAALDNPPPADLTRSDKTDDYKEKIITLGGQALQRSPSMPTWRDRLSPAEIADVVTYLRTLSPHKE